MANIKGGEVSVTYAGTGASDAIWIAAGASYQINIGTGTVRLEGSLDGTNFVTIPLPDGTTGTSFTASTIGSLVPAPMWARFNCTAFTSAVSAQMVATPGQEPLA